MTMVQTRGIRVIKRDQREYAAREIEGRDNGTAKDIARAVHATISSWVREFKRRELEVMRPLGKRVDFMVIDLLKFRMIALIRTPHKAILKTCFSIFDN